MIVVSEETGIISMLLGGQIERSLDGDSLRNRLATIFAGQESDKEMQAVGDVGAAMIHIWSRYFRNLLLSNLQLKCSFLWRSNLYGSHEQ